ncbi:response regulator [Streptomyces sp. NPDC059627]
MITLVVADDQTTVREALAVMLGLADDVTVVATAANGAEAVEAAGRHRPDVVLMDLNMPVMSGVEATGHIHRNLPDTDVLMLTTFDDDESILAALQAGASGYLTKEAGRTTILHAVRTAAQGQTVLAPEVQRRLRARASRPPPVAPPEDEGVGLTAREGEILGLIGEGLRNTEIAAQLVISEATVKTHINNIFAKGGFHSRADAVRYALRLRRAPGGAPARDHGR